MEAQALAIGVMATSSKQVGELTRLVRGAGFRVAAAVNLVAEQVSALPAADAWLVNLDFSQQAAKALLDQLESCGVPVIYDDDLQPAQGDRAESPSVVRQQSERRLALKLQQLLRDNTPLEVSDAPRARKLWVIAASTGGPEAVGEFLRNIPGDLAGVALLYVQHIDSHGHNNLCRVVAKHSLWTVRSVDKTCVVREKTVYVVSPAQQFELSEAGVMSPVAEPWGGRYRPCIDQVIAKVARVYRDRGGAIIFTGMGDDGANSCTLMHHRGGQIWVQQASSCTIDSMPVSAEKKGCVSFSGKPAALAQQFVYFHRHGRLSLAPAMGQ